MVVQALPREDYNPIFENYSFEMEHFTLRNQIFYFKEVVLQVFLGQRLQSCGLSNFPDDPIVQSLNPGYLKMQCAEQ